MLEFQALYKGNMIRHEIFWKENSFIFENYTLYSQNPTTRKI